jgi:hypothetical protein
MAHLIDICDSARRNLYSPGSGFVAATLCEILRFLGLPDEVSELDATADDCFVDRRLMDRELEREANKNMPASCTNRPKALSLGSSLNAF